MHFNLSNTLNWYLDIFILNLPFKTVASNENDTYVQLFILLMF